MDPKNVHGKFKWGALRCDRDYYKGYDESGYIKGGPCIPLPEIANGKFEGGGYPLIPRCDQGYVYVVARQQTPDKLLAPNEMECVQVPPEKQQSRNKCPNGTVPIAAMSRKDQQKYPYGAQCAR